MHYTSLKSGEAFSEAYGCPNISDYLDPLSYVLLDVNDFEKSYSIIKTAIEEDWWLQRIDIIRKEKDKILNQMSFSQL